MHHEAQSPGMCLKICSLYRVTLSATSASSHVNVHLHDCMEILNSAWRASIASSETLTKVRENVCVCILRVAAVGGLGWGIDGVNTPAYMDWANIQFVLSRLSSTVAATQFLPIDLPATGTIILHRRHNGPRIRSSQQRWPEAGRAGAERRWGLNPPRGGNEMN